MVITPFTPIPNVRQVDVFGGFTAAAGHHLYTARDFPQEYWNRVALVCEPTGHLLHRAIIEPDGAGYSEKDGWNLLASSDEWVSPVHAQVGPDGAVWILDWYNFIIQHNPTPPGFENGPGNAHINPLRDKSRGRIYRLVYDGKTPKPLPMLGPDKPENCLEALSNDNLFWRLHDTRESDRIAAGYQDDKQVVDYSGDGIETTGWQNIETPSRWSKTSARELQNFDGIVWVRREFEIAAGLAGKSARLSLGPVDDSDDTYLNGKRIGGMVRKWDEVREYPVPAGLLRPGNNQLTVRISDSGGRGGIYGEKEQVFVQIGNEKIDLSGIWKYKIEEQFKPDQEVFEDGIEITELFLKHYGPYAQELSKQLPDVANEEFDRIIEMKTVPDQMRYDREELEVSAGEKVKIVFSNNDGMQHNLLIGTPGTLEMIGKAADQMAQSAAGAEREYIPQLTVVLAAAGLVDPGETREIVWDVPDEPGDYIFVCTFPGHWRTMNGVIRVKKQVQL
jgi:uncharacterized protein